jgi:import receptor subunit TOM22
MVKLTQIEDEQEAAFQEQQAHTSTNAPVVDEDFESESDSDSDDDDFDEDETVYERIVALKDIVPPKQRGQISSFASAAYNTIYSGVSKTGNLTWILTTSALLLGVPLSLSILAEQQLMELEKEFKLQQGANDILAPGTEQTDSASPVAV